MKSKDIVITSKKMIESNQIDINGLAKDFSDTTFWYYTTLETAKLILKNKCFYVNNLTKMNDKAEADNHKMTANSIYALCFCNSKSEKIPMWYLYSGLTGRGVSIGITPAVMLEFIRSIENVQGVNDNAQYLRNKDFDLSAAWVYYREQKTNRVMFRNKWYSVSDGDQFFSEDNLFVKDYPWEYEKEFRIVIKTKKPPRDSQKLKINIPDSLVSKLRLRIAPEMSDSISDVKKFAYDEKISGILPKNISKSDLNIKMGLFERNIENLKASWDMLIKEGYIKKDDYEFFYEGIKPYISTS